MQELQLNLLHFQRKILESKRCVILVFEGPDAAGKGGVIKRITEKLDPRVLRVYSIIKPTEEEYRRHYLWRFWTKMPVEGEIAIFDRSWYGRVLVERVEDFCSEKEWRRAYGEINNMEEALVDGGALLMKFYLHISKEEQLRRFEQRAADPYKHWKISDEDWRNRRKWKEHIEAAEEMFEKTSTRSRRDAGRERIQILRAAQGAEIGRQKNLPRVWGVGLAPEGRRLRCGAAEMTVWREHAVFCPACRSFCS